MDCLKEPEFNPPSCTYVKMKDVSFIYLFSFLFFCQNIQLSSAIDAIPMPFTENQPNGEKIVLMLHGDEFENSLTDMNGKSLKFPLA